MKPRGNYRHIEKLFRFYYRELPARKDAATDDLCYTRKRIKELLAYGPYPSQGVTDYQTTGHGKGGHGDSTYWQSLSSEEKQEYYAEIKRLRRDEQTLTKELHEYEVIARVVPVALGILSDEMVQVIEKHFRDNIPVRNIDLCCDASTLRYHLDAALMHIHRFLSPRFRRESLPFLLREMPELFEPLTQEPPPLRRAVLNKS